MADWHGVMGKRTVGYSRRSMRDEDFDEEEVLSVINDTQNSISTRKSKNYYSSSRDSSSSSSSSNSSSTWRLPISASRMIPKTTTATSALTTSHEANTKVVQQLSAPVKIPDWSKIYGKNVARMGSWENNDHDHDDGDDDDDYNHNNDVNDDDDDDDGMVPPHEWIARKLARSQISSFSMCEGIGRTLKGRDLSKVRNAVLTKTGFLE